MHLNCFDSLDDIKIRAGIYLSNTDTKESTYLRCKAHLRLLKK
jgi:hypothetical protein